MRVFLVLIVALCGLNAVKAATNEVLAVRTHFLDGTSLSAPELEGVIKLANLCGIRTVTEVSTELHLEGITIQVVGNEKVEGRSVTFKTLWICPKDSRRVRPVDAQSVGGFWARDSKPGNEERAIVRIGDRELRVGLLDGIKPAGADKILDAFAKGRVQFHDEFVKKSLSEADVMQPSWIGISRDRLWITFAARPFTRFIFGLEGDQIALLDRTLSYE